MTDLTAREIIALLGGAPEVARKLKIKPPSVHGWLVDGIPDGRLIELAAEIEALAPDRFSRRAQWPDRCESIWPDLRVVSANDAAALAPRAAA